MEHLDPARRHRDELLVWTVGLADGQGVAGAGVELWSDTRQQMTAGKTDENGLLRLRVPADPN